MIRAMLATGTAVSLTAGLFAAPAVAAPKDTRSGKVARTNSGDYSNQELSERGKNRRINAKRTGKGSVQGAATLRTKANKFAPNKKVRLVTTYSSDGTVAGFQGVQAKTVKANEIDDVIAQAEANKNVVAIEEDRPVKVAEVGAQAEPGGGQYYQWALHRLSARSLWEQSTGQGIKVAILDTGVKADHPDLAGQMLPGKDFVNDGYSANQDPQGHGTHVAGIVAASMNSIGVTGLAPDAKIIPIRVLGASGSGSLSGIAKGIREAADRDADVINMSLGATGSSSPTLQSAVEYARSKGVSVVAAMGNNSGHVYSIPGVLPGVIGVASTTSSDARSSFSNYNEFTDVAAPGSGIMSTYPSASYSSLSGTSMATPYAAATVAIALQAARKLSSAATGVGVEQVVLDSAFDLGSTGWDQYFGHGRIDPLAAAYAVSGMAPPVQSKPPQSSPAKPKPAKKKLKMTVKVKRAGAKLRRVTIRSANPVALKVKLTKKTRGKWRAQRTLSLRKNGQVNVRLGAGQYRLHRNATSAHYTLNQLFRVR